MHLCLILLCLSCTAALSITTEQTLRQWYIATGGPSWRRQDGWREAFAQGSAPPAVAPHSWCSWYGVRCEEGGPLLHRHITALDLSDNNLSGVLPAGLFCPELTSSAQGIADVGFNSLQVLNLSHNRLSGVDPFFHSPGPAQASPAGSVNNTHGVICTEQNTAVLRHLEIIDISFNRLTSSLRYFLHQRRLSGTAKRMPKLRWISARGNVFHDVISDPGLPARQIDRSPLFPLLETLDVGDNHLVGEFPSAALAHHAPYLRVLKLDKNFFVNAALTWLGDDMGRGMDASLGWYHTLSVLHLQDNYIQASIPASVGHFTSLVDLSLDGNRIYGTIPRELRSLRQLRVLSLAHNYLRGSLPCAQDRWFAETSPFLQLRVVDLTDNELEGSICAVAPGHPIEVLRLGDNAFRGIVPPLEGHRLVEVTLGGENRWECELPDAAQVPSWIDPAPSTKCFVGRSGADPDSGRKRWEGANNSPSTSTTIRADATRRGSWWRNGLLGVLLPHSTPTTSGSLEGQQPMGDVARHMISVTLTLIVVVPLSVVLMKLAGVHLPARFSASADGVPGPRCFLWLIGYEDPGVLPAEHAREVEAAWNGDGSLSDSSDEEFSTTA